MGSPPRRTCLWSMRATTNFFRGQNISKALLLIWFLTKESSHLIGDILASQKLVVATGSELPTCLWSMRVVGGPRSPSSRQRPEVPEARLGDDVPDEGPFPGRHGSYFLGIAKILAVSFVPFEIISPLGASRTAEGGGEGGRRAVRWMWRRCVKRKQRSRG